MGHEPMHARADGEAGHEVPASSQTRLNMSSRILHYLPIIHTPTDLGSLAGAVASGVDAPSLERRTRAVDAAWERIETWLASLDAEFAAATLVIYQDGLPVCDAGSAVSEPKIVRELAESGSRNHRLLQTLMQRGATVMGTESPALLVQELELARSAVTPHARPDPRVGARARTVLEMRDRFIAARINDTLPINKRGVLLLGALHDPSSWLADDIKIDYPLGLPRRPGTRQGAHA